MIKARYKKQVMQILCRYADDFQQMGNDEAYLDLTNLCLNFEEAMKTAKLIRDEIIKKLGITISIGIASTKSLAKIASDYNKPNGITVFRPDNFKDLIKEMDVTRIPGIGKKSKAYFYKKGIKRIGDIHKISLQPDTPFPWGPAIPSGHAAGNFPIHASSVFPGSPHPSLAASTRLS